jgi:hypothetical protein
MSEFLDVIQFKKNQDKWRVIKLGWARPSDKGGYDCEFDVQPLGDENGKVRFCIRPRREQENKRVSDDAGMNDAIPF